MERGNEMKFEIDLKFNVGQKVYLAYVPYGERPKAVEATIIDMEFTCQSVADRRFTCATCLVENEELGRMEVEDCWLFLTENEAQFRADVINDQIREHQDQYAEIFMKWWRRTGETK